MRLFLAIDLPDKIKKSIDSQLQAIKKEYRDFNWIPPENLHITLLFLGEGHHEKEVIKKVENAIFEIRPFYLYSLDADLFINSKILLYIGFRREKTIEILAENLDDEFALENQQKFVPHITIARYKIPSKQQYHHLKKKLVQLPIDIDFEVNTLTLFESITTGKRPTYKKIHQFKLQK